MVRAITVYHGPFTCSTDSTLDGLVAVNMAIARTEITILHVAIGVLDTRLELPLPQQGKIGGFKYCSVACFFHPG
jgi:hypothetical protein